MNTQPRHPKCRALPVEPHPDIHFSAMIPRRAVKIKLFLSVVIYAVKAAVVPLSAIGKNPANARVARLCGVSPYPVTDTATALPKQARYQLRYTRLLSFYPAGRILPNQARYQLRYTRILNDLMGMDPPEATRRRALHTIPVHYNTPAAKREAYSYPFFFGRGLICTWTGWIN